MLPAERVLACLLEVPGYLIGNEVLVALPFPAFVSLLTSTHILAWEYLQQTFGT